MKSMLLESIERGEVKVIKIKDVSLKRNFSIIYHKNKYLTQSANDFINLAYKNNSQY